MPAKVRRAFANLTNSTARPAEDPTTKIAAMLLQPTASEQRLRRRLDRKAEEMRALKDCLLALREDRQKERAALEQKARAAERAAEDQARHSAEALASCHAEIRRVHELHQATSTERQRDIDEWKRLAARGTDDLARVRTELRDAKAGNTTRDEALAAWEEVAAKSTEELEASRVELRHAKVCVDGLKQELKEEQARRVQDAQGTLAAQDSLKAKCAALADAHADHRQRCAELEAQLFATREKAASAASEAATKVAEAADIAAAAAGSAHMLAEEAAKELKAALHSQKLHMMAHASRLAERLRAAEESAQMQAEDSAGHRTRAADTITRQAKLLNAMSSTPTDTNTAIRDVMWAEGGVVNEHEGEEENDVGKQEDAQLLAHLLAEDDDLQSEKRREQAVEGARIAADALSEQEARLSRRYDERTRIAVHEAIEKTRVALSAAATDEWNDHHETFEREMKDARHAMEAKVKETAEKKFCRGAPCGHRRGQPRKFRRGKGARHEARESTPRRSGGVAPCPKKSAGVAFLYRAGRPSPPCPTYFFHPRSPERTRRPNIHALAHAGE